MATGSSRLPSRFMKIIMDPHADRLEIPREFIKRHRHILPSCVFLKVPGGPAIEAELVQCSLGKTWIETGWSEFKQCCTIGVGHFLVFEYNMRAEFTFLIFDMSAVEINYPMCQDNGLDSNSSPVSRRRTKAENQDESDDEWSPSYEKHQNSKFARRNIRRKCKLGCSTDEKCDRGAGGEFLTNVKREKNVAKETSTAYRKAVAFSTRLKNPFHIEVMTHSTVSRGFHLHLPVSFARQNVPRKVTNVIMMAFQGKQWPVNCILRTRQSSLSGGWGAFARGNGLKIGDVCVFEVANTSDKLVWNVTVFRKD